MKRGWNEVARLGRTGSRYPHVLVDRHGWCLRLGASHRGDERYFATLPSLLEGVVEHCVRARMVDRAGVAPAGPAPVGLSGLDGLIKEIHEALEGAREMARVTAATIDS